MQSVFNADEIQLATSVVGIGTNYKKVISLRWCGSVLFWMYNKGRYKQSIIVIEWYFDEQYRYHVRPYPPVEHHKTYHGLHSCTAQPEQISWTQLCQVWITDENGPLYAVFIRNISYSISIRDTMWSIVSVFIIVQHDKSRNQIFTNFLSRNTPGDLIHKIEACQNHLKLNYNLSHTDTIMPVLCNGHVRKYKPWRRDK